MIPKLSVGLLHSPHQPPRRGNQLPGLSDILHGFLIYFAVGVMQSALWRMLCVRLPTTTAYTITDDVGFAFHQYLSTVVAGLLVSIADVVDGFSFEPIYSISRCGFAACPFSSLHCLSRECRVIHHHRTPFRKSWSRFSVDCIIWRASWFGIEVVRTCHSFWLLGFLFTVDSARYTRLELLFSMRAWDLHLRDFFWLLGNY